MKKIVAMLMVSLLVLPTTLWAQEMDKELAQTIVTVKEKINVPSEFAEFNYNMEGREEEKLYRLSWSDKEYKLGQVQIVADQEANILHYYKYRYDENYSLLAKISYEEGLKRGKAFIEKVAPHYSEQLRIVEENQRGQGPRYNYVFDYYANDVKVLGNKVSVGVSKQTGEVLEFSGLPSYKGSYKDGAAKISLEKAKEIYKEEIGAKLVYRLRYDYKAKTVNSFPVYTINNGQYKTVDAHTGKVFIPFKGENLSYGRYKAEYDTADVSANGLAGGLTPAEEKVVEETKGLLTKEQAIERAKKYFPNLKTLSIENTSLYKTTYGNDYIWQISGQGGDIAKTNISSEKIMLMIAAGDTDSLPEGVQKSVRFSVNAKTGEMISYYYNEFNSLSTFPITEIDEQSVRAKVEAFLGNIAKDKYTLTSYVKEEETEIQPLSDRQPQRSYYYQRIANGIPVEGNGLRVTYDARKDQIISYTMNWNDVDFENIKNVVAEEKIIDQIGLRLMYVDQDEKSRILGYTHEESNLSFNPFIGNRVNAYDGTPISINQTTSYDDIKGHPQESIIKKLYDSGIYLPDKSFKPNATINQYDFLRLVLKESSATLSEEDLYNRAINQGVIDPNEKNKDLPITKELAVKYLINSTAYKKIAQLTDIYKYPFVDEEEATKELRGYVSLAYGLKIIKKDTTNQFNPKAELTRAGAAEMIYNMLVNE